MKTRCHQRSGARAFTLLEVVVVLAITALVLGAVYSLAQGTLTLADDVNRAQRRDTRTQAFTNFCEHLFADLPTTTQMNLAISPSGRQYLSMLELRHVRSPLDENSDCRVTLNLEEQPGGNLRLRLSSKHENREGNESSVILFEDLAQCEWTVFHPTFKKWVSVWTESISGFSSTTVAHPPMVKLVIDQGGKTYEQVFWVVPIESSAMVPVR